MEHQATNDLTGLAVVALAALICGILLERLRQPAIVGYILAGVAPGPAGFGLVGEASVAPLAELGVLEVQGKISRAGGGNFVRLDAAASVK